jgi:hypothetical protein
MNAELLSHRIRTAASPREAILMLAEAIDEINARPAVAAVDPWDEWTDLASMVQDEAEANARAIAAVQEQLKAATGEDAQALQAQLNILRDAAGELVYDGKGASRPPVDDGRRTRIDGDTVDLVPVSQERKDARYEWAIKHALHDFTPPLTEVGAAQAFAAGGPAWLYEGNRAAIMMMPYEWRVWLVEELTRDSVTEGQEMARDILKVIEGVDADYAQEIWKQDND